MGIEKLFGSKSKSSADLAAAQEAAAKKERERLANEAAIAEANSEAKAQSAKRRAFVSGLVEDDTVKRRKFLKAA